MSKGRDFRGPRKRGFDDDGPSYDFGSRPPQRSQRSTFGGSPQFGGGFPDMAAGPSSSAPAIDATVKWFKTDKGFGFVELDNGTGDAFLHIGAVQQAGYDTLPPGAKLKVNVAAGQKGQQVTRVLEVDLSTAQERPAPRSFGGDAPRPPRRAAPDPSSAASVHGNVKWFDETKGFGFVQANDGGKDVFVHISILAPSGVQRLPDGQAVEMQVVDTPKGREAISISLA